MANDKPPNKTLRGIRDSIPPGYLLGRVSKGVGPVELISSGQAQAAGIVPTPSPPSPVGFGFTVDGLMTDHQLIGSGVFSRDVNFSGAGNTGTSVKNILAATSSAAFTIYATLSGVPTLIGTITFAPGAFVGVVNFPSAVLVPAGSAITLYAPTPADPTLGTITATITGAYDGV